MDQRCGIHHSHVASHRRSRAPRGAIAALLWLLATSASAGPIYKCVGSDGHVTFRDTACATGARQVKLDVAGQPLIDPDAPPPAPDTRADRSAASTRQAASRRAPRTPARARQAMSWECRAADGEVFYRHTRCPATLPGDGVVRGDYAEKVAAAYPRRRHDAWARVPVHGVRVARSEACRRIASAGAAVRDGHQHDEATSAYDRMTDRDPCAAE